MVQFPRLAAFLLLVACGPVMAIDEPAHTVVQKYDAFEVRRYEATLVAEVTVDAPVDEAGNEGFRILAGYIFGKNKGARKIEMTAPVAQIPAKIEMTAPVALSASSAGYVIRFSMPTEWTLETLPEPTDPRVKIWSMPARVVAVIVYSGTWSQSRYDEHLNKLKVALEREGLRWIGEPVWARYDPPWKPWFMRRNEIWLGLTQ